MREIASTHFCLCAVSNGLMCRVGGIWNERKMMMWKARLRERYPI
jgi:hypothetical protein